MSRILCVFFALTLFLPNVCIAQDYRDHSPDTMKLKAKSRAMALFLSETPAKAPAKDTVHPVKDTGLPMPVVEPCGRCTVSVDEAFAASQREKRFICVWVGGCNPQIRDLLPECIHLVVPSWEGNSTKRLVVPTTIGNYSWDEKRIRSCPLCVEDEVRQMITPVAAVAVTAYTYPVP